MRKRMLSGIVLGVIGAVMMMSGGALAEETALRAPATRHTRLSDR